MPWIVIFFLMPLSLFAEGKHEQLTLFSTHLNESRSISITLPEHYHSSKKTYPVLLVLDGEYAYDYALGAVNFLSNDFNYFPEMIVVGIPNTIRLRDMQVTFDDEAPYHNFVEFLEKELLKLIDERYRTSGFRVLYGWSSASGICDHILIKKPQLIDGYILSGCGIGPKTEAFIRDNLPTSYNRQKYLYVNVEGEEPRRSGLIRYQNVVEEISPGNLKSRFEIIEESNHVEVMAKGIYDGLKFVFADFMLPQPVLDQGYQAIWEYYQNVSQTFRTDFTMPIGAINETAGFLYYQDRKKDAFRLLQSGINLHPYSATLEGSLGELYQAEAKMDLAKAHFKKAMEKSTDSTEDHLKYRALLDSFPH